MNWHVFPNCLLLRGLKKHSFFFPSVLEFGPKASHVAQLFSYIPSSRVHSSYLLSLNPFVMIPAVILRSGHA